MRILLVNDYATPTAGAEQITKHLRDSFGSRGHEVRTFASRAQLIAGESFADATCFGTNTRLQTITSAVNPSSAKALRRELTSFSPDVVQVQMFMWQLSPLILPLLRSTVSVYYTMTFKPVCPTGLKWLPRGVPCGERAGIACVNNQCITMAGAPPLMLQRYLWRRDRDAFTAVVGSSKAVKEQLEADGVTVRTVIWPGTPDAEPRPPLIDPPTVTYAGRLTPEKGVDILIRAFSQARQRCPQARLLVAGSGPETPKLRALIEQLGISDSVMMCGQLGGKQLDDVLRCAWVHVVPSRWPEPFGLTATEAMMRGTAVIASRIGGLAESVDDQTTGLHVTPGDERELANALSQVLGDRILAERLGAAGRTRAITLFSIDRCVTQFEALYDTLTSETSRTRAG
jgi:glycosyltransferase involved in cell wall biosynthesis